jgi:hypothetical protein
MTGSHFIKPATPLDVIKQALTKLKPRNKVLDSMRVMEKILNMDKHIEGEMKYRSEHVINR